MDAAGWIAIVTAGAAAGGALLSAYVGVNVKLARMAERVELLWKREVERAVDVLHHATQPDMDGLLEALQAGTSAVPELEQLADRLKKLAGAPDSPPKTVGAAEVLLADVAPKLKAAVKQAPRRTASEEMQANQDAARMAASTEAESQGTPKAPEAAPVSAPEQPAPAPAGRSHTLALQDDEQATITVAKKEKGTE